MGWGVYFNNHDDYDYGRRVIVRARQNTQWLCNF
jgi:hypothetical protein